MIEVMLHILENPWAPEGGASDHDSIYSKFIEASLGLFGGGDIAITNDGDVYARVVFDFAYECPVGITTVHLTTCATMNSKFGNTTVLQWFCNLRNNTIVVIPP